MMYFYCTIFTDTETCWSRWHKKYVIILKCVFCSLNTLYTCLNNTLDGAVSINIVRSATLSVYWWDVNKYCLDITYVWGINIMFIYAILLLSEYCELCHQTFIDSLITWDAKKEKKLRNFVHGNTGNMEEPSTYIRFNDDLPKDSKELKFHKFSRKQSYKYQVSYTFLRIFRAENRLSEYNILKENGRVNKVLGSIK